MSNISTLTSEQIQQYKNLLPQLQLDEQQTTKAKEFIEVIEKCDGNLTTAARVMIRRTGVSLIMWSTKPVEISLDDFASWAKGERKISVYYDVPHHELMGEF